MIKISFKKVRDSLKKYYFYILGFFLIILISFNFYIYYKYIYLITNTEIEAINDEVKIDQETLQSILDDINAREDNLDRIKTGNYEDPFNN